MKTKLIKRCLLMHTFDFVPFIQEHMSVETEVVLCSTINYLSLSCEYYAVWMNIFYRSPSKFELGRRIFDAMFKILIKSSIEFFTGSVY